MTVKQPRPCQYEVSEGRECGHARSATIHVIGPESHEFVPAVESGKKRRAIAPRSRKQRAKDDAYEPTRKQVLLEEPACRACLVQGPRANRATDVHHVVSRARGGSNERSNLVGLCNGHHIWIHQTVEGQRWGTENGLLSRNEATTSRSEPPGGPSEAERKQQ